MERWSIDCQSAAPQVLLGAQALSAAVQEHAGYLPVIGNAGKRCIHMALDAGLEENSYSLDVEEASTEGQQVWIRGADENALMYGCMDFVYEDLNRAAQAHQSGNPYYFHSLFGERPLPCIHRRAKPAIAHRGLWMWGHVIYDARGLFESMARVKLNEIIIWNDALPVNSREIADMAHAYGIKVIWGFAWGWDTGTTKLDLSDPAALEKAADAVVEKYRREYAHCGGDGIYFQSFTETSLEVLNGRLIAQVVVEWVNGIARRLYAEYPHLLLQFGLHATSVSQRLDYIAKTDPRIHIIWEDCGDFPYAYVPEAPKDPAGTEEFTRKMLTLRPGTVNGAVLKGMICLDWGKFEHQRGPYLMGCASEKVIRERLEQVRPIWRYVQAGWMTQGDHCRSIVEMLAREPSELYALAEDGLVEREMPLPVALFASICWNPYRDFSEILRDTACRNDVVLY